MRILKQHQGLSMMTVLGVVTFWLVVISTSIVFVFNNANIVDKTISYDQEYAEAVSAIDAAYQVIGPAILAGAYDHTDPSWVAFHESLGIVVTKEGETYLLSRNVGSRSYSGSLTVSGSAVDSISELDGSEPIDEETFLADNMLNAYLNYIEVSDETMSFTNLGDLANLNYDFEISDIDDMPLELSGTTYISDGDTVIIDKSITHLDTNNNLLYVDGNLEISNSVNNSFYLDGVVIVNGNMNVPNNVTLRGVIIVEGNLTVQNGVTLEGLLIVNGTTSFGSTVDFGTAQNPSFLFSKGAININTQFDLYGFLFSESTITIANGNGNGSNSLIGGIYSFVAPPTIGKHYGPIQPLDISILQDQEYLQFLVDETSGSGSSLVVSQPSVT